MCLFPKLIKNKKYQPTEKNNYNPPPLVDTRLAYVAVGCGNCIECRKQKSNMWRVRLLQELKVQKDALFVTFSFSPDSLKFLMDKYKLCECNALATKAMRLFLERYRKKYKKMPKHFFITELGDNFTERIHLHGIWFNNDSTEELERIWSYGNIFVGDYCTERTINYVVKYITKIDNVHKNFRNEILCSPGLGKNYVELPKVRYMNRFRGVDTYEKYRLNDGKEIGLPIYYRNKLFTDGEREELWLNKIEEHRTYILGNRYDCNTIEDLEHIDEIRKNAQDYNKRLGFGDDSKDWKKENYNVTYRMLNKLNKTKKLD